MNLFAFAVFVFMAAVAVVWGAVICLAILRLNGAI